MCELFDMSEPLSIKDLRLSLGLTLEEFAREIGLTSKGHASEVERAGHCSLRVALAVEELSGGRIDAASLNEEVRLARHAVHAPTDTAAEQCPSSDKSSKNIGGPD